MESTNQFEKKRKHVAAHGHASRQSGPCSFRGRCGTFLFDYCEFVLERARNPKINDRLRCSLLDALSPRNARCSLPGPVFVMFSRVFGSVLAGHASCFRAGTNLSPHDVQRGNAARDRMR